jgi:general secretion pathway protein B
LISAGVLIGWLQPWQQEDPMQRSAPAAESMAESAAAAINTPTTAQSVPAATMQPELAPSALIQPTRSQPALTQPTLTPPIAHIPAPAATLPPSPSAAQVSPAQSSPTQTSSDPLITTAEKKVIPFSDLPAALRQSIPDISIAFHQYSNNPAERRAMINNEVLRAGDQIAPGLLLEQITSDGVILSYAGYTFKRGVR